MRGCIREYLQCAGVLFGDFTIYALLIEMAPLLMASSLVYDPSAWLFALALQLLISLMLLHHGTSWTVYLCVQAAAIAAEMALSCFMFMSDMYIAEFRECFAIVAASIGIHAAYVAYKHPSANLYVGYVDVTVGVLIFYLYVEYSVGRSGPEFWLLGVLSVIFDLVVVGWLRTQAENGHRISGAGTMAKVILIAAPVVFLIITALIIGRGSGQIHGLVDLFLLAAQKIWAVIYLVIEAIVYILASIIVFIVRILPNTPVYLQDAAPPAMEDAAEATEEIKGSLPAWLFPLIFGVIAAAFIIWGLYILRNTHIRLNTLRSKNARVVRKSYLFPSILSLLKRMGAFISFEWDYLINRHTPQGLYLIAVHRGERMKIKKKESESPPAYLRRLKGRLDEEQRISGDTGTALLSLAGILDDIFYGGKSVKLKKDEYTDYARLIRLISGA